MLTATTVVDVALFSFSSGKIVIGYLAFKGEFDKSLQPRGQLGTYPSMAKTKIFGTPRYPKSMLYLA